jgi:outer membrane protein OmpA-like peptidoglycan-associated protein
MKKQTTVFLILAAFFAVYANADEAGDGWAFGLGVGYPRYNAVNLNVLNSNVNGYLSIQKDFLCHAGLRFKASYYHLEGQWIDFSSNKQTESTGLLAGDLDFLYYFTPSEPLSLYVFGGGGVVNKSFTNPQTPAALKDKSGTELNAGLGAEFSLDTDLNLGFEFGYHATNNSTLDGTVVPAEANGCDSYIAISMGINYFFGKDASVKCSPCQGVAAEAKAAVDPEVNIVAQELIVDKAIVRVSDDRVALVGVNFAFDKSSLLQASYPVLKKAVEILAKRTAVNIEIEGYTDYVGSGDYNMQLSEERAKTVKDYLVSKGISPGRLKTIGYGKNNPIEKNTTEAGRSMNRRIVFKIVK